MEDSDEERERNEREELDDNEDDNENENEKFTENEMDSNRMSLDSLYEKRYVRKHYNISRTHLLFNLTFYMIHSGVMF